MFGIKTKLKKFFHSTQTTKLHDKQSILALMKKFKADEYGHRSNISNRDLGYGWIHYGFIRQCKPKKILAIGSRHGYIPAILAQACKENGFGHVDFVDAGYGWDDKNGWTGEGYWKTKKGKNCFHEFGLTNHITLFVTTTKKFAQKYSNIQYDYIYIDGNHSYKGVYFDYTTFLPYLVKGGFMSFHDICVKEKKLEGEYGVWKLWEKLKKKHNAFEFPFTGSGLGVIQK